jgi:HPt (histidine-containing phosphotransfer) domain-containing protein
MGRLLDFSAGDPLQLDELVTVYVTQTTQNLVRIEQALTARESSEALRLAHSSAGASATCGMTAMTAPFREIEHLMGSNKFLEAMALLRVLDREFDRTKQYLQEQRSRMAA